MGESDDLEAKPHHIDRDCPACRAVVDEFERLTAAAADRDAAVEAERRRLVNECIRVVTDVLLDREIGDDDDADEILHAIAALRSSVPDPDVPPVAQ